MRADGTALRGGGVIMPVRRGTDAPREFVGVLQDRSAGATQDVGTRQHAELAQAAAEAENDAKDQFLAMLGHELRTPLTAILLWAQMLKNGQAREQAEEAAEVILRMPKCRSS